MNPSRVPALGLILLFAAGSASAAELCGRDASELKTKFLAASPLDLSGEEPACRDLRQLSDGRPDGDSDDAFNGRWQSAASGLQLSDDESRQARPKYEAKTKTSRTAKNARGSDHAALDGDGKLGSQAQGIASALGTMREDGGVVGGNPGTWSPTPGAPGNGPATSAPGAHIDNREIPGVETLHAMGSPDVAPAPGAVLRAKSLWAWGASDTVKQDVQTVKANAEKLQLPPEAATGLASSEASLPGFQAWVKNAKDSDLPTIEYGVLNEGEIGRYQRGLLGKGTITLNIAIKDAEPSARGAVLFHELYHYWDNEVERLHYGNVSYGYIDRGHIPEHEYDAYYLTALMWQQTKPDGASSPLSKFLDGLPSDRQQVTQFVEGNLKAIKEK